MVRQTFLNLPEEKRRRIVEVALEEFAARPYSKASLSNIVARARIAKGSMYQYFEDKKDLFVYLLNMAAQEKLAYIQEEVDPAADFFTAFEQSMMAGTRFGLEHPQLNKIIANAMDPLAEEALQELMAQGKRMSIEFFEKMILNGQEKGTVRRDINPLLVANILQAVLGPALMDYILEVLGVTTQKFLSDAEVTKKFSEEMVKDVIDEVIKLLREGLQNKDR